MSEGKSTCERDQATDGKAAPADEKVVSLDKYKANQTAKKHRDALKQILAEAEKLTW